MRVRSSSVDSIVLVSVAISGAKNAALKLLAAATLTGERCRFTNVPEIEDVRVMAETLRDLGVVVDHPEPLAELRRLLSVGRAYEHLSRALDLAGRGELAAAAEEADSARALAPQERR